MDQDSSKQAKAEADHAFWLLVKAWLWAWAIMLVVAFGVGFVDVAINPSHFNNYR